MIEPTILIALIIGLTEVAKKIGLDNRWCPLVALALGIGLNFGLKFIGGQGSELLIGGIVAGLTAVGLYSGVKNTVTG